MLLPAAGRVLMNGQPVVGAAVVFEPSGSGANPSQAETDSEGRFEMETYLNNQYKPGVSPGEYVVTISKLETVTNMRKRPKNLLPAKYESPETTDLKAMVKADGDNEFTFRLE